MTPDPRLDEALSAWGRARAEGRDPTPEELCADRPDLVSAVAAAIDAVRRVEGLIDRDTAAADPDATLPPPADAAGLTATLGPANPAAPAPAEPPPGYAIEGELGRGGMGVVYLARQTTLNRRVALKMILAGAHASPQELVRFLAEAEAIAQLQHPNIVQIYEIAEFGGRPYFTLEFCEGGSLDRKLAGNPLPPREAAGLIVTLAKAVHAAHGAGIVHRDLKPQNVLLAADGTPKVTDFGLAKRVGSGDGLTATGAVMGTPSYMAPEQAQGSKTVGPAADVYALAALLYELLTGRPPFRAATPLDTILQVVTEEPVAPTRLNPQVPADLETICLMGLRKDPARRYASAAALADDLGRWLAGDPIAARPPSSLELGRRWVRKNPTKTVAALAVCVIAAFYTGFSALDRAAQRERNEQLQKANDAAVAAAQNAQREKDNADREAAAAQQARTAAEADKVRAVAEEQRAVRALADLKSERGQSADFKYATRINRAFAEWRSVNTTFARGTLADCPAELRGWEWSFLHRLFESGSLPLKGHGGHLIGGLTNPDGTRAYTTTFVTTDKTVRVWDTRTGVEVRSIPYQAHRIAASPDGKYLSLAVGGAVRTFEPDTGREVGYFEAGEAPFGLEYVRGGKELAVVTRGGALTFRDPFSGRERTPRAKKLLKLDPGTENLLVARGVGVTVSPDGRYAAQGGADCKVRVWDAATGELVMEGAGHLKRVGQVAFSPDGKLLASPGGEGHVIIWDLETRKPVRTLKGHTSWVWSAAFSPDGKRLVTAAKDLTARVWDVATGDTLLTLTGHQGELCGAVFAGGPARVLTFGMEGVARVWDAADRVVQADHVREFFRKANLPEFGNTGSPHYLTFYGHLSQAVTVDLSPDGRLVATSAKEDSDAGHQIVVWDIDARREVTRIAGPMVSGHPLAFSPDGRHLVVANTEGSGKPAKVVAHEVPSGKPAWTWTGPAVDSPQPAFSPDGSRLAVVLASQKHPNWLVVLDARTGAEVFRKGLPAVHGKPCFTPDGARIVAPAVQAGKVRVFDAKTGDAVKEWPASPVAVLASECSSAGVVATADATARIKLWDLTGKELRTLEGHAGLVTWLAFSPDGRRLFTGGNDFTARLWHVETGLELLTFRDHTDASHGGAWSRDGSRLATTCADGALRVWEGPPPDAAPTADAWPVVFADAFDRTSVGAAWKPAMGTWEARDGALRGSLAPNTYGATKFNIAKANLTAHTLPNRADVRFRFRASRPQVVSANLSDPTGHRLLFAPILAGPCDLPGSPTAFLMQLTNPTGRPDDMKVNAVGQPRPYAHEAGRWYRVRVLREPERVRVWVDGAAVLDERVPDADLPALALQGAWAAVGDVIEFDDVEVRAPADAVRELAVRTRTKELFTQLKVRGEVRRRLAAEPATTPADLAAIDRALSGLTEDGAALTAAAAAVVWRAGAPADDYRLALARAEAAHRAAPTDPERLGVLGLARLRAGQPREAVEALTKAVERAREDVGAAVPAQRAGLALAHHALGDRAAALRELGHLRWLMASDKWATDNRSRVLLGEAAAALGAAAADPTAEAIARRVLAAELDGWVGHDLAKYLALYAPGAVAVAGRGPTPDAHDVTLNRAQLEAARRIHFRGPPTPGSTFSLEDVSVAIDGDAATARWVWVIHNPDNYDSYGVVYRLARGAGGWQVTAVRGWPHARKRDGVREAFTAGEWAARDMAADAATDPLAKVEALRKAERFADAFRVAKAATDGGKGTAALWAARGEAAVQLGDAADATAAFRAAEARDPDVQLPWYLTRVVAKFPRHGDGVGGAAFLPGGDKVVSAGGDGRVRVWNAATGRELRAMSPGLTLGGRTLVEGEGLAGLAVSRDGTRVAAAGRFVWVWDADGAKVAVGGGHAGTVYRLAFSPDGKRIVSASGDGSARVWEAATGRTLARFTGHGGKPVLGAEFTPDGRRCVSCGHDGTAQLWDAETGAKVREYKGHAAGVNRAVLSPDGATLATVGLDKTVRLWDVEAAKPLHVLAGHDQSIDAAAFAPDGARVATGDWGGTIRVWDAKSGAKVLTIRGHPGQVWSLAFSPDGRRLVAAGSGGAAVYDLDPIR